MGRIDFTEDVYKRQVAEYPENADAASVTQLLENVRYGLKISDFRHMVKALQSVLAVIMGQTFVAHGKCLLFLVRVFLYLIHI